MSSVLQSPVASDDATDHADFLELSSLKAGDRNVSLQDLVRTIRASSSTEALQDDDGEELPIDRGSEISQAVSEATFDEIEDRERACGGENGRYAFTVTRHLLQLKSDAESSIYLFLLLLSKYGIDAGPKGIDGERLFETICSRAALNYFGGSELGAEAISFGFPRASGPKHFPDALSELCKKVGDMTVKVDAHKIDQQKDGKLDIVVFRHFPDRRAGKLLGFGQCAAGRSKWQDKAKELQIHSFKGRWLREGPAVDPVRLFFIPWRVLDPDHTNLCLDGGIVFDRCRIAYLSSGLDASVTQQCEKWSRHAIKHHLR